MTNQQGAPEALTDFERRHAIRQGYEIAASDGYFEARPQIDSNDRRKVFQAGFERGWDRHAALVEAQQPAQSAAVASKAVLAAIRAANLQLVRTGDDGFMLVTLKQATPQADSVTAPAGGADWQDISTAPKDGTRFVAVGQNYGLDSEAQHTCIAQWLAGCWVEVSDWNGASKLKYLTHWMPLPPLPCSAARTPADSVLEDAETALRKVLGVVQRYLPPDGPSAHDSLSEIIEIVDPWPLGPLEKP
jgi:hypothetical protein